MSGAETARRRVVQRRIGDAEMALPPYICIYIYIIYICTLVCTNIIFVEIHFKFRYEFFRSIKITDNLITHNMYVYYITSKWRALYKVSKGSTARLTAKKYTRSSLWNDFFLYDRLNNSANLVYRLIDKNFAHSARSE